MALKQKLARKAVKSTARHTAHGTLSKLRRDPARMTTLLGLGALAGFLVGWLLGRRTGAGSAEPPAPAAAPPTSPVATPVSGAAL
jgi:hypothetical protein